MEMAERQEYRSAEFRDVEVKDMDFRGYAAVFDAPWNKALVEKMGYVETVAAGAFRKALAASGNIPLLWQHERRDMLATTQSGNLRIKEDGKGLLVEAKLPSNPLGEYVRSMIASGDVRGMSYGIETAPEDSSIRRQDGMIYRTIRSARRLIDTTLTWEPAYDATTVELRNLSGFAAVPLQELIGGSEEQTDDAAGVTHPPFRRDPEIDRRVMAICHTTLEGGLFT
jgi:HK97 family phage prohead protease